VIKLAVHYVTWLAGSGSKITTFAISIPYLPVHCTTYRTPIMINSYLLLIMPINRLFSVKITVLYWRISLWFRLPLGGGTWNLTDLLLAQDWSTLKIWSRYKHIFSCHAHETNLHDCLILLHHQSY